MGSFTVYIPAKWMNASDIEVALKTVDLFNDSVSPKHKARIKICIPLTADQLAEFHTRIDWPFASVIKEEEQSPSEDMFLLFPSMFGDYTEVSKFRIPILSYRNKQIKQYFRHEALMLVDPAVKAPEKVFARTLHMLYFDPGAQRIMRKNLKVKRRREALPRLTSPLTRILLSN